MTVDAHRGESTAPIDCDHMPDPESLELDCAPTNEWSVVCDLCGATLFTQSDTRPDPRDERIWG